MSTTARTDLPTGVNPWPALWAMVLGFFMILVDTTIVQVATPALMRDLDADVTAVLWVTSAYLLAYAVPLLITGRLGDRVGPRVLYLVGLTMFTLASLWCGLTDSITTLVAARVVQGLGASLMTPQTMAVITRTFPADRRGTAMALWGATAGVAMLAGPLLGGLLVDALGWEWIFFVNVPVGIVGFVLAWRWLPRLPTHSHSFDVVGMLLSGVGMFLLVFGIQEGESYDWGRIVGPVTVWWLIGAGVVVLVIFVWWQARVRREPLVPLGLFADRNFTLTNLAITTVGFSLVSMGFPLMLWAQQVRGLSPTRAALLVIPLAVLSGVLAPLAGRLVDRMHPRLVSSFGLGVGALSLLWLSRTMTADGSYLPVLGALALQGVGNAFIWSPLTVTATRNLPPDRAGAGAGVYNTTRQVGAVLGSAAIATLMQARLAAELPAAVAGAPGSPRGSGQGGVPEPLREGFATAMSQSLLLPAGVLLLGFLAVLFLERPAHLRGRVPGRSRATIDRL